MKYFLGEYYHTMDAKGRVSLPSRFREIISNQFYISRGPDNTLYIYPEWSFQKIIETIMSIPQSEEMRTAKSEAFLRGVVEGQLDQHGRIRLDAKFIEYAKLDKKVVFTGAGNRIKIYAKAVFDQLNQQSDEVVTADTYKYLGI